MTPASSCSRHWRVRELALKICERHVTQLQALGAANKVEQLGRKKRVEECKANVIGR